MAKQRNARGQFSGNGQPAVKYDRQAAASQALGRLKELGVDVRPVNGQSGGNKDQMPIPHIIQFSGYASQLGKVYRNPDNAWRDSRDNARHMLNDLSITECLDARQLAVALMPWHVETDGDKSSTAQELVLTMTNLLRKIPRFTEYRRSLLMANWYGRQGMQHNFGEAMLKGRRVKTLVGDHRYPAWSPISGDKLAFPYDRQGLGIRIGYSVGNDGLKWYGDKNENGTLPDMFWDGDRVRKVEITSEYGRVYWLDDDELERVVVHKHFVEDAAFEQPMQAGRVHGVGIRDRIYWTWFLKQNTAALLTEYLERSAFGFEVWTYPMGNDAALGAIKEAAETRSGFGKNIVFVPVMPGQEGTMDFQHQEVSAQGMELYNSLIHEYYEWQIKRFILGQVQSTEPVGGGLGTSGMSDLQGKSLRQILLYDAQNLEETITIGLLAALRKRNRHLLPIHSDAIDLYFRIDTRADEAEKVIETLEKCHTMGLPIKTDSLYDAAGLEKPTKDDAVLMAGAPPRSLSEHQAAGPQPGTPESGGPDQTGPQPEGEPASEPDETDSGEQAESETPHDGPDRYKSTGWVTMGAHGDPPRGGARVYMEDGKITKGPKNLTGKKPGQISKKPRNRLDDLEDVDPYKPPPERKTKEGLTGKQELKRKNRVTVNYDALYAQNTADAAKRHRLPKEQLREAVEDLWRHEKDRTDEREKAKVELRSKFKPDELAAIRKRFADGGDYTKIAGWDNLTRTYVDEHPDLGLGFGDDLDTQENLWQFINEGRILPTPKHDPELIERAAEGMRRGKKKQASQDYLDLVKEMESVEFRRPGDPDRYGKPAPLPIIDLGGRLRVIDDSTDPPRWKTICNLAPASEANAIKEMKRRGLRAAWLFDDIGDKRYLTI
jgi:hypothetical protein